jgi:N-acetyl-anhydromuramyl-L-alanine amidase AmpD
MFSLIDNFTNRIVGKTDAKSQIILCHTSRNSNEYLISLKYRKNKKYDKIPNFLVTKDGKIIDLLPSETYSNFFDNHDVNKNSIIISLENLGWLEKKQLSSHYINWIGDIYKGVPYDRKWRDYFLWDPYSTEQINSLVKLCLDMCQKHKIPIECIGHNTKITNIEKLNGIVSKSNFDQIFTDVSPAFDFDKFTNMLKNEQL